MTETVSGKQRFVFITHIGDVYELKTQKYKSGAGKDALFDTDSRGWYIRVGEGSNAIALHIGDEQPKMQKGQKARLIIEIE